MVTATDRRTGPKDRRTTPDTVVDAVVEALHGLIEHPDPDVRVAVLLLHSDCVLAPRHRRSLN